MTIMLALIGYQQKRINDLQEDIEVIRRDYVRRDDLTVQLGSVNKSLDEVKVDVRDMGRTLLLVLAEVKADDHRKI